MKGMKTPGSGRKKGTPNKTTREMRELFQAEGPASVALLVQFRDDETKDDELRKSCAESILDRGYGKPSRTLELQTRSGVDYDNMTDTELAARAERVLAALAAKAATRQLPEHTEGIEIIDGGVVVPDDPPTGGVAPVAAKPKGAVTE